MENVRQFVIDYIEREYQIPADVDQDSFNFVQTGYVDSIGVVQFITILEDEFGVEFTDEELADETYQTVGNMVKLIESKLNK